MINTQGICKSVSRSALASFFVLSSAIPFAQAQEQPPQPLQQTAPQIIMDQLTRANPNPQGQLDVSPEILARRMLNFQKSISPEANILCSPEKGLHALKGTQIEKEKAFMDYYTERYRLAFGDPKKTYMADLLREDNVEKAAMFAFGEGKNTGWVRGFYTDKWLSALIDNKRARFELDIIEQILPEGNPQHLNVKVSDEAIAEIKRKALMPDVSETDFNRVRRNIHLKQLQLELAVIMGRPEGEIQAYADILEEQLSVMFDNIKVIISSPVPPAPAQKIA